MLRLRRARVKRLVEPARGAVTPHRDAPYATCSTASFTTGRRSRRRARRRRNASPAGRRGRGRAGVAGAGEEVAGVGDAHDVDVRALAGPAVDEHELGVGVLEIRPAAQGRPALDQHPVRAELRRRLPSTSAAMPLSSATWRASSGASGPRPGAARPRRARPRAGGGALLLEEMPEIRQHRVLHRGGAAAAIVSLSVIARAPRPVRPRELNPAARPGKPGGSSLAGAARLVGLEMDVGGGPRCAAGPPPDRRRGRGG